MQVDQILNKDNAQQKTVLVQRYVEQCLRYFLNKEETKYLLQSQANIDPEYTTQVWESLEAMYPDFFSAYELKRRLADQILAYNHLYKMISAQPTESIPAQSQGETLAKIGGKGVSVTNKPQTRGERKRVHNDLEADKENINPNILNPATKKPVHTPNPQLKPPQQPFIHVTVTRPQQTRVSSDALLSTTPILSTANMNSSVLREIRLPSESPKNPQTPQQVAQSTTYRSRDPRLEPPRAEKRPLILSRVVKPRTSDGLSNTSPLEALALASERSHSRLSPVNTEIATSQTEGSQPVAQQSNLTLRSQGLPIKESRPFDSLPQETRIQEPPESLANQATPSIPRPSAIGALPPARASPQKAQPPSNTTNANTPSPSILKLRQQLYPSQAPPPTNQGTSEQTDSTPHRSSQPRLTRKALPKTNIQYLLDVVLKKKENNK